MRSNERLFYQIITRLTSLPTVRNQIDTIRTSRHIKMEANERRITVNFLIFYDLLFYRCNSLYPRIIA